MKAKDNLLDDQTMAIGYLGTQLKNKDHGFFVAGAFTAEILGSQRNNAVSWLFVAEGGKLVANNNWLQKTLEFLNNNDV